MNELFNNPEWFYKLQDKKINNMIFRLSFMSRLREEFYVTLH